MSKKIIKQCKCCLKEFESYPGRNQIFCSRSCKGYFQETGHVKTEQEKKECPICHNPFIVTFVRKIHCSNKCRHIGHRKNPLMIVTDYPKTAKIKKCCDCNNEFIAKQAKRRCNDCQIKHTRSYAKEYSKKDSWKKMHNLEVKKWQRNNKKKVQAATRAKLHPEWVEILYTCPCVEKKENHHPNYKKPFEVWKLCHTCHMREHKRLRDLTRITTSNEVAI
jgi:hypothetical protein